MKRQILLFACFAFMVNILQAQTTYTYTGTGNWTDTANWSPSYPGLFIPNGDIAIISAGSEATVPNGSGGISIEGRIDINGTLIINAVSSFGAFGPLFNIRVNSSGTLQNNTTIFNNGNLTIIGMLINNGFINNDNVFQSVGSFNNQNVVRNRTGGVMTLVSNSSFVNMNSGIFNDLGGQLNLSGTNLTGAISNSGSITFGSAGIHGTLTNTNTGTITNPTSTFTIFSGGTIINDGTINTVRNFTISNGATLTNSDALNINGSTFAINSGGELINSTTGSITNNATFINNSDFTNNGSLINNNVYTNNGFLRGTNTAHTGDFVNAALGDVSPGGILPENPIGTYTFNDNFTLQSSAFFPSIFIDVNGNSQGGIDYDQVVVMGDITLAGRLLVQLPLGYTPQGGDEYTVLTGASISGTFDQTSLPPLANGEWVVNYTPTSVILNVLAGCSATVTTYTGSGPDNGWDNGIPDATTNAVIAANYDTGTIDNIIACTITVNTGATLNVADDTYLDITTTLTVNGNLTIANAGSVVQRFANAATINNGLISVSKTTPLLNPRDFILLTPPMEAQNRFGAYAAADRVFSILSNNFIPNEDVSDLFPMAANFIDDNGDYLSNSVNNITSGVGYLVFPQPVSATDPVVFNHTYSSTVGRLTSGPREYGVVYNGPATENNFNLFGNPYPSAIDIAALIQFNNAIDEVYFWEHITPPDQSLPGFNTANFSMDDVSVRNAMMGVAAVNDMGGDAPGQYMASGQGFGILANQSAMGAGALSNLRFNNSMRVTGNNGTPRSANLDNKLWLRLDSETYTIQSRIGLGFVPEATPAFDSGYDSRQLATTISLFSILEDGQRLSIQGREVFDPTIEINLGFQTLIPETENYTISIDQLEGDDLEQSDIFLIDHLLGTTSNLKETSYTFASSETIQDNRFTLVFDDKLLSTAETNLESTISLYPNPARDQIQLTYTGNQALQSLTITDIQGKIIRQQNLNNFTGQQTINLSQLKAGLYLINITSAQSTFTQKVIIQ